MIKVACGPQRALTSRAGVRRKERRNSTRCVCMACPRLRCSMARRVLSSAPARHTPCQLAFRPWTKCIHGLPGCI